MKAKTCQTAVLFALPCLFFAACGGPVDANPATAAETTEQAAVAVPAESAEATVRHVVDGLLEHQPDRAWAAMPSSYRQDVERLVTAFSERLDADLYDRGFVLVGRMGNLLQEKKDLFLASEMFPAAVDRKEAAANWDAVTGMIQTLANSEIARLESLSTLNIENFLRTTGRSLLAEAERAAAAAGEDLFEELRNLKIEVVDSDGDESTLRLSSGEFSQEVEFIRIENRWVPRELADEWSSSIAEALTQIEGMSKEQLQAMKPQVLGAYGMLEGIIAQLEAVETVQQLDATLQVAMFSVLGMFMGGGMPGMEMQSR